jgi:glycosyltransferase involved in cell wall biosynthesis
MRIGFIGNQNNYPFILARGLRRRGHDVRVVIDQVHALDRPESRYADVPYPYPDWIRDTPTVYLPDIVFNTPRWQAVIDLVRDCDALVLNSWGFDAASQLPMPAYVLSTGSDVEFWSNPQAAEVYGRLTDEQPAVGGWEWARQAMTLNRLDWPSVVSIADSAPSPVRRAFRKHLFTRFAQRQRAGLMCACGVNSLPDGISPGMGQVLRECVPADVPRSHFLMADIDWITPQAAPANQVLRIFNAARVLWKKPFPAQVGDWENKGTDVLLKGIALWHERTGRPVDVRLVEKGPSVGPTRELVRALGIEHLVSWQGELTQAGVFEEYVKADIVAEQCGSHVVGMAGYEAMAAGRPVIANGRPDLYVPLPMGLPPVAQAATPEEVAWQLARLSDPSRRERLAAQGRRFVETHLSVDGAARHVEAVLEAAVRSSDASCATPSPARTQGRPGTPSLRRTTVPSP